MKVRTSWKERLFNIEFVLCQDDENGEEEIMHALSGDVRKNSFTHLNKNKGYIACHSNS